MHSDIDLLIVGGEKEFDLAQFAVCGSTISADGEQTWSTMRTRGSMEYFLSVTKTYENFSCQLCHNGEKSKQEKNCNQMVEANVQSQNWSHRRERSGFWPQAGASVQTNCCSHTHSSHSSCSPFCCCESLQPAPLSDYTNAQEKSILLFFCTRRALLLSVGLKYKSFCSYEFAL